MLKYLSVFALFAATLVLTGCKSKEQTEADNKAVKEEQDKLKGKWKLASRGGDKDEGEEKEEKEEKADPTSYFGYVIEDDILKNVYVDKDGKEEVLSRQKMTITPGKEPKQMDLTYVDESGKAMTSTSTVSAGRGKTKKKTTTLKSLAVYKIDGDKLTLCISYDDKKRPTDLTAPPGSKSYVLNLEKMK